MLQGEYGKQVDLWCVGIIMSVLLTSKIPYGSDSGSNGFEALHKIIAETDLRAQVLQVRLFNAE